ncbi:MAG: helix-turn-helix transcriptional regulator [Clostridia bacterium]|nr:helix-turn-helix transcriptional regulator [Clostridia bacterium]
MKIGSKIKELRKRRGITQEQLANSIGISFQAVSKWENGIALPDITLAPMLANYFGVSMDELFDYNRSDIEREIEEITEESWKYRETDPDEGRRILEAGLLKYPDNDILLNNLLYVLNYTENPDETIAIASALIEKTDQADVKYDALRFLAYAFKAKGDIISAEAAIEQIPEIYFTKLSELAFLLDGPRKREAAEKQKWISFEDLLQMMEKLAECYEAEGDKEKAMEELQKALQLIPILENSSFDEYADYFKSRIEKLK